MARQFFNYLAHKREGMDEEEIPDNKDASRPFLHRGKGEVGIYLDPLEAQAANPKEFGLEHAFMMSLKDNLQDYLSEEVDLVQIKGALEHRGLFRGVILEEVRKGMVLVVTFNDLEAVDELWKLHEANRLSKLFQELLVTKDTLKYCSVTRLLLRVRMWDDENTACKAEMEEFQQQSQSEDDRRLPLSKFENDMKLLKAIREYQKTLGEYTLVMRDLEDDFEKNIDDFMIDVRRIYPENTTSIQSLGDFHKSVKMAKGVRKTGFELIDKFLKTLETLGKQFSDIEKSVCYRLSQIHGACETDEQKELKDVIRSSRKEMEEFLKVDHNLMKVRFKDSKISQRDRKMFLGLTSLIPIGLEKMIDLDHNIDEYITGFPDQV